MKTITKLLIITYSMSLAAIAGFISGCGTTTPSSNVSSLRQNNQPSTAQPAPQSTPTAEDQDWDTALKPFSLTKVEAFLDRYPNGSHAAKARQIIEDEHVIEQIIASGPGSHFVLPRECVPSRFISPEPADNEERSRIIITVADTVAGPLAFTIIEFGHMPIYNGLTVMPGGDLSVFVVSGTFDNIQGAPPDGIRILHSKQYGFIVIGGKGKIFSTHNGVNGDIIFQTQP